uniref:Interleukin 15 n=1 Tax=Callorhinchus milii TaxID=7868 RepID=V9LKT2_CALMI
MRLWFSVSVSVYLVMGLVSAKVKKNDCAKECFGVFFKLQEIVRTEEDIRLYTPHGQTAKVCPQKTTVCFAAELHVLIFEYDGIWKENVTELAASVIECLEHFLHNLRMPSACGHTEPSLPTGCPMCEQFHEESVLLFLEHLKKFLQFIYYCCNICLSE